MACLFSEVSALQALRPEFHPLESHTDKKLDSEEVETQHLRIAGQ